MDQVSLQTLLLQGLKRYMKDVNPSVHDLDFLDEKHADFKGFRGVRDNVARGSRKAGIGATVNHTNIVTSEEEDLLWSIDILRMSSPRVLSNTILFLTGMVFCLRGGREHYALKLSQFTFATGLVSGEQRECVVYVENGSKNHSGSYKDKGSNKSVRKIHNLGNDVMFPF